MKKGYSLLALYMFIGLLTGSLIAYLLRDVQILTFLTKSMPISWSPGADFDFVKYEFYIQVRISILSIIGLVTAIWIYRRT
jgi:hypothetical protein